MSRPGVLSAATRFMFFTGKGGVGKTSLATATAVALADSGRNVLLVSTDPASNLDEILGVSLRNTPVPVPGVDRLRVLNIDPQTAAESYRQRVLAQMPTDAEASEVAEVREALSGACTTEIAAFDEFSALLAETDDNCDHVIFDTAPTGHTLRLLSLPKIWSGFLLGNARGASCLGPHSGLKMQEDRFKTALFGLTDAALTTVVLVTRAERSALGEAARTAIELRELGLGNQRLAVNGVFHASDPTDAVAQSIDMQGRAALAELPEPLAALPRDEFPLRPFDIVGLASLRGFFDATADVSVSSATAVEVSNGDHAGLGALVAEFARFDHGLIMVMGKGGVGKTTIAAALAIGLVEQGKYVHLSTTDPAAHLAVTLAGELTGLRVSRIDPKRETTRYIEKVMATRGAALDAAGRALLLEDMQSPCTEEVAVFTAFAHLVQEARRGFVVLDTAPTGHTLLLMDATGAYHRQVMRSAGADQSVHLVTPLMRLQDPAYTHIVVVTLPETTPVSQAAALQEDLRRAHIEPYAWVVNRSVLAAGTRDPLLAARLDNERRQMARIGAGLAARMFVVPWLVRPPVGVEELSLLVGGDSASSSPTPASEALSQGAGLAPPLTSPE